MAVSSASPQVAARAPARFGLAAGLLLAMAAVSAAVALWSAWLLLRGESMPIALRALPAGCRWAVLVDAPAEVPAALEAWATHPSPPAGLRAAVLAEARVWRALVATQGLQPGEPWAVCGLQAGAVVALPDGGGGLDAARAWHDRLTEAAWLRALAVPGLAPWSPDPAARWNVAGPRAFLAAADGRVRAVASREQGVVLLALAPAGRAPELLDRARASAVERPLAEDEAFRAAVERVGGGQIHLYLSGDALREATADPAVLVGWPRADAQPWRGALPVVAWLGLALRNDADGLRLHGHAGTGAPGAAWLKGTFDVVGTLDAAPLVDPRAVAAGVVRMPLDAWGVWAGPQSAAGRLAHRLGGSGDAAKARELAGALTGQAVWQKLDAGDPDLAGKGEVVLFQIRDHTKLPAWVVRAMTADASVRAAPGYLVLGHTADLAARGAELVARPHSPDRLGVETRRMFGTTQGLFVREGSFAETPWLVGWQGPLEAEWLWLDTGLIAELRLLPAAAAR